MQRFGTVFKRRRPTASARRESAAERIERNREAEIEAAEIEAAERDSPNQINENEHEERGESAYGGVDNDSDDDDEILRVAFPGGPNDPSVLSSFKTHVAAAIWEGKERDALKCYCLTTRIMKWKCQGTSEEWKNLVRRTRLTHLRKLSYKAPHRNLISAFVERWHPETNSFHFPFGEMTITLDDVYCITGLEVTGNPVEFIGEDVAVGQPVVRRLLGVSSAKADAAMSDKNGWSVKLKWLEEEFSSLTSSDDPRVALYAARAYLLYLLGCTCFADKSGDRVSTQYLRLFEDPDDFGQYAWGTAALAYLYRQLGMASRAGIKQIAGYLTLLEVWIYAHFPTIIRPQLNDNYSEGTPMAGRWKQEIHPKGSESGVKAYRTMLDSLTAQDVVWDAYSSFRKDVERPEVVFYEGCITAGDIVEVYLPDRVLRQFGFVQTIPRIPLQPSLVRRGKKPGQYRVQWNALAQLYDKWDSHKLSADRRGRVVIEPSHCVPEYIEWFNSISHPIVSRAHHTPQQQHDQLSSSHDGYAVAASYLAPIMTRWREEKWEQTLRSRQHKESSSTTEEVYHYLEYAMPRVEEAFEYLTIQSRRHGSSSSRQ